MSADFTLTDRNIAEVERRLPNRNGKVFYKDLWEVRGKGDTANPPCMHECPVEGRIASALPDAARDANGNIAEQVRPFGPARGTDTTLPPRRDPVGVATPLEVAQPVANATPTTAPASVPNPARSPLGDAAALLGANSCSGCHGIANKIVGPAFQDIAKKYAGRPDAADYLAGRIRSGSQGAWGSMPMPAQPQLNAVDAKTIATWIVGGAK